jgi:hypothetical protein
MLSVKGELKVENMPRLRDGREISLESEKAKNILHLDDNFDCVN